MTDEIKQIQEAWGIAVSDIFEVPVQTNAIAASLEAVLDAVRNNKEKAADLAASLHTEVLAGRIAPDTLDTRFGTGFLLGLLTGGTLLLAALGEDDEPAEVPDRF